MSRIGERVARTIGVGALVSALALTVWRHVTPSASCGEGMVLRVNAADDSSATSIARQLGTIEAATTRQALALAPKSAGDTGADLCTFSHVTARLAVIPSSALRAIFGAAREAGTHVTWQDAVRVRDLAVGIDRLPAPQSSLGVAAVFSGRDSTRSALTLRDAGGVIDSIDARGSSSTALRVRAASVRAPVMVDVRRDAQLIARVPLQLPTAPTVRGVLLFAQPGWETKFVSAALEESGWTVDGAIRIAPRTSVRLGTPSMADTTRYSAVVVLDSGLVAPRVLQRFAEQGGGVIIAGDALRDGALAAFASVRVENDRAPIAGGLLTDAPRRGLAAWRLAPQSSMSIVERDAVAPIVVASRRATGRVLASGYRGTWHWRMEGTDDGVDEHRRWWNALVARVAFASVVDTPPITTRWPGNAAPVADLIARLGAGSPVSSEATATPSWHFPLWVLFVIAAMALLSEWAMRRLRGAP